MKATFLSFALASALAFAGGGVAMAQHRGGHAGFHAGGGHVGVHVGRGHAGFRIGGFHVGFGNRYYGHRYYWPYYGSGVYWGTPYYYGSPVYSYAAPTYEPPVTYTSPATVTTEEQPVMLTVLVPNADAKVFLNGTATTLKGEERVFQSPPMDPGKNYQYTVTARWMKDGKMVEQKRHGAGAGRPGCDGRLPVDTGNRGAAGNQVTIVEMISEGRGATLAVRRVPCCIPLQCSIPRSYNHLRDCRNLA